MPLRRVGASKVWQSMSHMAQASACASVADVAIEAQADACAMWFLNSCSVRMLELLVDS